MWWEIEITCLWKYVLKKVIQNNSSLRWLIFTHLYKKKIIFSKLIKVCACPLTRITFDKKLTVFVTFSLKTSVATLFRFHVFFLVSASLIFSILFFQFRRPKVNLNQSVSKAELFVHWFCQFCRDIIIGLKNPEHRKSQDSSIRSNTNRRKSGWLFQDRVRTSNDTSSKLTKNNFVEKNLKTNHKVKTCINHKIIIFP